MATKKKILYIVEAMGGGVFTYIVDGCSNNNPKKPRVIGNRVSVLDRLHIKLEERKRKEQGQQQQQQERSRKN